MPLLNFTTVVFKLWSVGDFQGHRTHISPLMKVLSTILLPFGCILLFFRPHSRILGSGFYFQRQPPILNFDLFNKRVQILTPWCRVLLEKLTGLQQVKKFPAFHGTRRFITALTSVRHLSLSWASPIQSIYPHPTSWISILILSTLLRLGLPSCLLPSGFPTKILYTPLSSPIRATCPAHLILLDFITRTILGKEYKSFSF